MSQVVQVISSLTHFATAQVNCGQSGLPCDTGLPTVSASSATLHDALQIIFAVIGAVALVFVVVAALQFVTSNGDPQGTAKARQSIIYASIGLAIAVSAEAIVTFVLNNL